MTYTGWNKISHSVDRIDHPPLHPFIRAIPITKLVAL
jgi:hypothetical protein